jgi:hypothetical protein
MVITSVAGEMECNKRACLMILTKVVEDPQSGSCLNVSYADVSGPVANYNPTGSPYANHTGQHTPVQTASFNSSPSLSSSFTTGKLKLQTVDFFVLQIFRAYQQNSTVSVVRFLATDPEVRVRFLALPDFLSSSGSASGPTQPREYN